jgi:aerobic C4-dicarboxylate transport protein
MAGRSCPTWILFAQTTTRKESGLALFFVYSPGMKLLRQLYVQVLIAMMFAILVGLIAPELALKMKPLGDAFIALLRMMLGPIIFCSVVLGLTHVADMRQLGRLAFKALVYFEVVTTVAMALGFAVVNIVRPGDGLNARDLTLSDQAADIADAASNFTAVDFFLSIIPDTLVSAFSEGQILQVLFVSLLAGAALSLGGIRHDSIILKGIAEGQDLLFRMLGFIMKLAPLGAFGALAAAIGAFGSATLVYLAKLVILYWATSLVFIFFVLGAIAAYMGFSILSILRLIRDELTLVFGTASGEVVLPQLIRKLTSAGCDPAVVGFVLPAGYSFNLDGTSIYMAIAIGFIAQATNTPFSLLDQLGVLAILMLTSKGGTAVAGGAFVKLAATLQTVRSLPLGGLGLLFGIDRLMATCTAMTNIIGNTLAVFVIAKWENAFDQAQFTAFLASQGNEASEDSVPAISPDSTPD